MTFFMFYRQLTFAPLVDTDPTKFICPYKEIIFAFLFLTKMLIHFNVYSRRKYYCYHLNTKYFFYDSNIGFFSIAPHLIIALPTLRSQKLSLLISLLQFMYYFCRLVHAFFSILLPIQLSLFQLLRQQQLSFFYTLKGVSEK